MRTSRSATTCARWHWGTWGPPRRGRWGGQTRRTPNATSGTAPAWPGRSAAPTSKSPAWRSSGSHRWSSTRSPRPSGAAEYLGSQLADSQALATRTTRWLLATQARLGLPGEARAALAALDDERAGSGEIRNARAVICLAEGDPAAALAAVADVLDGTAPVQGSVTVMEAHLLAGLAHRQLGDQRAANQAAERALALAESDRLVLPFAMTGSAELLEALPRHQTAHAALLAGILDILHGASPAAQQQSSLPPAEELSPGELRVLRYLPTNLSRPEIAGELSVSLN